MEKQVFKVVRGMDHIHDRCDGLFSARLDHKVGAYVPVRYIPGEWVYASDGMSRLFAFEDVTSARHFKGRYLKEQVWLAEATGVQACPNYIPDIFTTGYDHKKDMPGLVGKWWGKIKRCEFGKWDKAIDDWRNLIAPRGSVLCTSIKLISHVS